MRYQAYQPPIELAEYIKLFWVFENRANNPIPETIITDGHPEIIIHFRSPFAELDHSGTFLKQSTAIACGQLTKPLVLQSSSDAGMLGIRFHPNGMAPFHSIPMQSLTDRRVPAGHLFPDIHQLNDIISISTNDAQRLSACSRFLIRRLDRERAGKCVRPALDSIIQTHGRLTVDDLADLTGRSRRSLELAFQRDVGISPKMFSRITRFRHVFDIISSKDLSANWVQIALDSGFFDQSHLIRDFRQFTGHSPTSYLPNRTSFAHSINQPE